MQLPSLATLSACFTLACLLFVPSNTAAETKTLIVDEVYTMGEGETPLYAEAMVLQRAKQKALEEAGTYVVSYTKIQNYDVTADEIQAIAGGILEVTVLEKTRRLVSTAVQFYVKIKAVVTLDRLGQLVGHLRNANRNDRAGDVQRQNDLASITWPQLLSKVSQDKQDFLFDPLFGLGIRAPGIARLRGSVRTMAVRVIGPGRDPVLLLTQSYDRKGNLLEEKEYDSLGKGERRATHIGYDDRGEISQAQTEEYSLLSEEERERFCGKGKASRCGTARTVTRYDRRGNKIKREEFYADGAISINWQAFYDGRGNRTRETQYDDMQLFGMDGSEAIFLYVPSTDQEATHITMYRAEKRNEFKLEFYGETTQRFDQRGKLLSEDKRSGRFDYSREHTYDPQGNLIRTEEVSWLGGKLVDLWGSREHPREKHVYDSLGQEVEEVVYDERGLIVGRSVRTYNVLGNLVEQVACGSSACKPVFTAKYDQDSLLREMHISLPREFQDLHTSQACEFDAVGNWIRCVRVTTTDQPRESGQQRVVLTLERTLIYY